MEDKVTMLSGDAKYWRKYSRDTSPSCMEVRPSVSVWVLVFGCTYRPQALINKNSFLLCIHVARGECRKPQSEPCIDFAASVEAVSRRCDSTHKVSTAAISLQTSRYQLCNNTHTRTHTYMSTAGRVSVGPEHGWCIRDCRTLRCTHTNLYN